MKMQFPKTDEQEVRSAFEYMHDENGGLLVQTTGHPLADLKMIVNALHDEDMPPVEVLGAMLCNVIDMLENKYPEIVQENVGFIAIEE